MGWDGIRTPILKKVGWIFAHPPREEGFLFSSAEVITAATLQLEAADGINDTPFVTVKVSNSRRSAVVCTRMDAHGPRGVPGFAGGGVAVRGVGGGGKAVAIAVAVIVYDRYGGCIGVVVAGGGGCGACVPWPMMTGHSRRER